MAIGGLVPTPSDAMIVLGLLDFGDKERAISAMKDLGEKLQLDAKATAKLIYRKMGEIIKQEVTNIVNEINSRPVYTVKELLYGKKLKPKYISLIGGPAKALAPLLEKEFNLPCYVPENYEIANAIGAALAKPTAEVTVLADTAEGKLSIPEIEIYEKIGKDFTVDKAEQKALELLREMASVIGASDKDFEGEITEKTSFNMVRGFYTCGKNIRVRAQIKPGLLYELRGVNHVEV